MEKFTNSWIEGSHMNSEPNSEPTREIDELRAAIAGVQGRIDWHEEQIQELQEKIKEHQTQQEELKKLLEKEVGGLVGIKKHIRPRKSSGARSGSTRSLIKQFLSVSGDAQDTDAIKSFLSEKGKETNPSVELSRMLKSGEVVRPKRGYYTMPEK
jgi:chromosome segregation ATPase